MIYTERVSVRSSKSGADAAHKKDHAEQETCCGEDRKQKEPAWRPERVGRDEQERGTCKNRRKSRRRVDSRVSLEQESRNIEE